MKRVFVIGAALAAVSSQAQVVLSGPGTYFQDFDSLASTGTGITWTNNLPTALMPGWYSLNATYDADDGSNGNTGQYSEGTVGSGERALGSVDQNGALLRYGIRLNNASGGTFNTLHLDYIGEQWRTGSTLTDALIFEYSTNATSLTSGNWNPLTALNFNSPNNTGTGVLNGNLPANQSFQTGNMTGLNWLNGTDMWVRWSHIGNASRDALALDTMHLNATPAPEPLTLTAFGAACAGLLARRRKAKASK
jgi:hypothetical protein